MLKQKQQFPSIRDIYYQFELANYETPEYSNFYRELEKKLLEKFSSDGEYREIECFVVKVCSEAQAMGFEQGFACAANLMIEITGKNVRE